ncbi:FAD:protein FMN transferase [Petrimonas sp.]|uniref:FAD:protein FMN transferase n=1 Tax=Petrimonas sp. TaxID=2023866 RepID=UPI003F515B12
MKLTKTAIFFVFIVLFASCGSGDKKKSNYPYFQNSGEIFHTLYNIKYAYNRSLESEILAELERFELSLNPFRENTIITKINNNVPVKADSMFMEVFNKAMEVSRMSDGKFDITASPLINAWGFGFKNMDSITPEIIDSLKQFVGYDKISVDSEGNVVKTDSRVQLNPSAISKGYSCDLVARLLDSYEIENYMVEIGGEVVAKGVNDKDVCWRIGVDKPIDDSTGLQHQLQTILSLCNKSLATSGNYRNYYLKDGKKYAHTIDPQTGYPSEQDILGATVIADDCMTADAYATAFMASGLEKSKEMARKIPGLHYYFIYAKPDGTVDVTYSEGFEQFFAE